MRKYINFIKISLVLIVFGFYGCYEQEVADTVSPDGNSVASYFTDFSGSEILEGDTIIYTVSIDKQLDHSLKFSAKVIGGTATSADYEASGGVIAAYSNSAELLIVFTKDYFSDKDETVQLEIGVHSVGQKYLLHKNSEPFPVLDVTIKNFVSDALEFTMSWGKDVYFWSGYIDLPDHGEQLSTCDYFDYDLEVYSDEGDYIGGSYSSCPEELNLSGLADGLYHCEVLLWENWFITDHTPEELARIDSVAIPVTFSFTQQGVFSDVIVEQAESDILTSKTLGYWESGSGAPTGEFPMLYPVDFKLENGIFTIIDPSETKAGRILDASNIRTRRKK